MQQMLFNVYFRSVCSLCARQKNDISCCTSLYSISHLCCVASICRRERREDEYAYCGDYSGIGDCWYFRHCCGGTSDNRHQTTTWCQTFVFFVVTYCVLNAYGFTFCVCADFTAARMLLFLRDECQCVSCLWHLNVTRIIAPHRTHQTPFRRHNRLSDGFDNRLNVCLHDAAGRSAGLTTSWTTAIVSFIHTFNRLSVRLYNRFDNRLNAQQVECMFTRCIRLFNRLFNRSHSMLYCVDGVVEKTKFKMNFATVKEKRAVVHKISSLRIYMYVWT